MRIVKVNNRQSIWDVANQYYGHPDGVLQLMIDNPGVVNFETSFDNGTRLQIDDTKIINKTIVDSISKNKRVLTTSYKTEGIVLPPPPYIRALYNNSIVTTFAGLNYSQGYGPSTTSVLFSIKAEGLNDDVTVTPSVNLDFWNGTAYVNTPFVIDQTGGDVDTAAIFKVRLKNGLATGTYNETLTLSGGGATNTVITVPCIVSAANQFIITVKTDNPGSSLDTQFMIPLNPALSYNYTVDWGDGAITNHTNSISPTHDFPVAGIYQIKISGIFPHILFNGSGDAQKLLSIDNWGNISWKSFEASFTGCSNMVGNYVDAPNTTQVTNMYAMFYGCAAFNSACNFSTINVLNMSYMYYGCVAYNQPVIFDTRNVLTMRFMFFGCTVFNSPVNFADVSKVLEMQNMFQNASAFNQPLNFNSISVTDFTAFLKNAIAFNSPINISTVSAIYLSSFFDNAAVFNQPVNFVTTSARYMNEMFISCVAFNRPINFVTDHVTTMYAMFYGCSVFNAVISFTNTSNVTDMAYMFFACSVFNRPVPFNTASVTRMSFMFYRAISFNQVINFSTPNLTTTANMFFQAYAFNSSISLNTINVTDMSYMFLQCYAFNQPVNFNTSNVLYMDQMFIGCGLFNQLLNFDMSNVTSIYAMLYGCVAFDQDISNWNISNVTNGAFFMFGKTAADYSASHLDLIYNTWSSLSLQPNVLMDFGTIKYTAAGVAGKAVFTGSPNNWTITDGGI